MTCTKSHTLNGAEPGPELSSDFYSTAYISLGTADPPPQVFGIPEGSAKEHDPTNTLISDFQPTELCDNKCLLL